MPDTTNNNQKQKNLQEMKKSIAKMSTAELIQHCMSKRSGEGEEDGSTEALRASWHHAQQSRGWR